MIGHYSIMAYDSTTKGYTNVNLPYDIGANSLKNAINNVFPYFDDI